ncbi:MAG TPA: hypothetical protein VMD58_10735 [Acidobacteriaceae bacterium]|nr:hypothetical protein [Acidobacteriaceae bacterium]
MEGLEQLGCAHGIKPDTEAFEATGDAAVAGVVEVVSAVVVAKALAAEGG